MPYIDNHTKKQQCTSEGSPLWKVEYCTTDGAAVDDDGTYICTNLSVLLLRSSDQPIHPPIHLSFLPATPLSRLPACLPVFFLLCQMSDMVGKLCDMSKDRVILSFAPKSWYYSTLKKVGETLSIGWFGLVGWLVPRRCVQPIPPPAPPRRSCSCRPSAFSLFSTGCRRFEGKSVLHSFKSVFARIF